jgi:maltose 6'-phosphate phosphatase
MRMTWRLRSRYSRLWITSGLIGLMLLSAAPATWADGCATGENLKLLTINLLFSEVTFRDLRLNTIADEVSTGSIDIILLQEVVGGKLSGTFNSAVDLKRKLAERGLDYELAYRLANGLPRLLSVGNAILSRCDIRFTVARSLPFVTEEPFEGIEIPLRRKAMMSRIDIPNFGKINVYNVHLCAFCDPAERTLQASVLFDFISDVERFVPGKRIVLGGDFNTEEGSPLYDAIVGSGLLDSYVAVDGPGRCAPPGDVFGCTFARPGNPFAPGETPQRIDYLFFAKWPSFPVQSEVIFVGPFDWVSDHSGVLSTIPLR